MSERKNEPVGRLVVDVFSDGKLFLSNTFFSGGHQKSALHGQYEGHFDAATIGDVLVKQIDSLMRRYKLEKECDKNDG